MVHGDYEWLNQSVMIFREDSIQGIVNALWISTLTSLMIDRNHKWLNQTACAVACNRWDRFIDGMRTRLLPRSFAKKWNQKRLNHLHSTLRADGWHRFVRRPRRASRRLRQEERFAQPDVPAGCG